MGMHFEICTFYHLIYTCLKFKRSHVLNIYFVSLFVCLFVSPALCVFRFGKLLRYADKCIADIMKVYIKRTTCK